MGLILGKEVSDKIKRTISKWPRRAQMEVFEILEDLADSPTVGKPDDENIIEGAYYYEFHIADHLPLSLSATVGYDFRWGEDGPEVEILGFVAGRYDDLDRKFYKSP